MTIKLESGPVRALWKRYERFGDHCYVNTRAAWYEVDARPEDLRWWGSERYWCRYRGPDI